MIPRTPRSTRPDTLLPHTPLFRSALLLRFPTIRLTNATFLLGCRMFPFLTHHPAHHCLVFFFVSHAVWFNFFTQGLHEFPDVLGFFVVCVWLIPLVVFVGLTADDTDLPFTSVSAKIGRAHV